MTAEQRDAFFAATNGIAPADLLMVIAMIVITFYTLWTVWLAFALVRGWYQESIDFYYLIWSLLRAVIMLLLVGYFVRP